MKTIMCCYVYGSDHPTKVNTEDGLKMIITEHLFHMINIP